MAILEELRCSSLKALQVPSDLKGGALKKRSCVLLEEPGWGGSGGQGCPFPSITSCVVSLGNQWGRPGNASAKSGI